MDFIRYPKQRTPKKGFKSSFYGVFFVFCAVFAYSNSGLAQDRPLPIAKPNATRSPEPTPTEPQMDLDSMKSDNPDDLWYRYKKPTERSLDHYPKFTPNSEVHLSKTYSPVAYKHLKNMAKFCNYNWGNDKCMQSLSALGIAVTKDYLKKIHNSKVAPSDLIEPSKKTLKEGCAGILLRAGGNIEPIQMSNGMKECVGTMTEISNALNEYPDMELRQLALSSTFCIVRQPKCKIIEGQLEMIAKPQMASIKPESNQEDEPVETGQGNDTQAEQ